MKADRHRARGLTYLVGESVAASASHIKLGYTSVCSHTHTPLTVFSLYVALRESSISVYGYESDVKRAFDGIGTSGRFSETSRLFLSRLADKFDSLLGSSLQQLSYEVVFGLLQGAEGYTTQVSRKSCLLARKFDANINVAQGVHARFASCYAVQHTLHAVQCTIYRQRTALYSDLQQSTHRFTWIKFLTTGQHPTIQIDTRPKKTSL